MRVDDTTLRALNLEDLNAAMALSIDAGWNQTEYDWTFMLEDEQNICVAAINDGKLVGTAMALNYSNRLSWLGMVLVDKNHRGKGISKSLLQYVFERCKTALKLDATALGEPVYEKFGFLPEYTIARMINTKLDAIHPHPNHLIKQASPTHIQVISALDEKVFGVDRSKLITYYVGQYPNKAWILEEENSIRGFALGRDGYRYHHIGPVIADTAEHAIALITQALEKLIGKPVVIDVLSDKPDVIKLLEKCGFIEQRRFVRMYKEENTFASDTEKIFAIAGPEFG